MLAACWFAVVKAGGIVVGTHAAAARQASWTPIVDKAQISHALCDARLADELALARAALPDADAGAALRSGDADDGLEALRRGTRPPSFDNVDTAADDICLIAFTSGTTGAAEGRRCTSTAT